MSSLTRMMTVLSVALLPGFALGHDFRIGDLHVEHPVARAAPASAMTSAGYMTIMNGGTEPDTLLAVEADFPRVTMHDSVTTDGIASMNAVPDVTIAPGDSVTFAPGGMHVMFMGLNGDALDVGESFHATLVFEKAGRLDIVFNVEDMSDAADTMPGMDHGNMKMDEPAGN